VWAGWDGGRLVRIVFSGSVPKMGELCVRVSRQGVKCGTSPAGDDGVSGGWPGSGGWQAGYGELARRGSGDVQAYPGLGPV